MVLILRGVFYGGRFVVASVSFDRAGIFGRWLIAGTLDIAGSLDILLRGVYMSSVVLLSRWFYLVRSLYFYHGRFG